MSLLTKESESIVSRYSAAFNTTNLATFEEVFDRDVVDHNPPPGQAPGLGGIKQMFRMMNVASPDSRVTIEGIITENDRIAVRMTIHATHQGEFRGLALTGKHVAMTRISIFRVEDGKIVEWRHYEDMLSMSRQLGLASTG